jgi:hypothetical protein
MDEHKPKSRKQLNKQQAKILLILYKFRFGTTELIVNFQVLESIRYSNTRLRILLDQGYIGRNYDDRYRLLNKPASYYLLPKGIKYLKQNPSYINPIVLNLAYKDKSASETFINRCLTIFELCNKLAKLYGKTNIDFFSKSEIAVAEYYPKPMPDAFLHFIDMFENLPDYMLELALTSTPFFAIRRRVLQYIDHFDSGEWEAKTASNYPNLLFVCESANLERRLQKCIYKILDKSGIDDLKCFTTTMKALVSSQRASDKIWSGVFEPDELISLGAM